MWKMSRNFDHVWYMVESGLPFPKSSKPTVIQPINNRMKALEVEDVNSPQ